MIRVIENIPAADVRPKWISVKEKLPEEGHPVLICGDQNHVYVGHYWPEWDHWYDWDGNRTFVHHWMPLPEPPNCGADMRGNPAAKSEVAGWIIGADINHQSDKEEGLG